MELPELPKAEWELAGPAGDPGYTADQMRAYGEQCILMERERCAKVCEALGGEEFEDPSGQRRRVEPSADDCAAAIRSPVKEE